MKIDSICFYARVPDISLFEKIDFYSNDIKILKDLGYKVLLCNDSKHIPVCDLYFIWWWSSGIIPLIKSKLLKKPNITIGNIHYSDPSRQGYKARPFYIKKFIKYSLKNSDVQLATSKIEYEDLKNFNPSNPLLLYHAIDERKYFFSNREREKIILTISRLLKLNVERKKIIEIIEAFNIVLREYPDYLLYIAGRKEDDGYEMVANKVAELGIGKSVVLTGSITDEEKIKLYHKSKVFVQPTDYEGFGLAIGESMSCGTPVVTSAKGAVPEVAGEFALYVNPNDVANIADGIKRLIEDQELYSYLSIKGSERIRKEFSFEKRRDSLKAILDNLISNQDYN